MSGADDHWTATGMRESFGERLEQVVEELREEDADFRDQHDDALRAASDAARNLR